MDSSGLQSRAKKAPLPRLSTVARTYTRAIRRYSSGQERAPSHRALLSQQCFLVHAIGDLKSVPLTVRGNIGLPIHPNEVIRTVVRALVNGRRREEWVVRARTLTLIGRRVIEVREERIVLPLDTNLVTRRA